MAGPESVRGQQHQVALRRPEMTLCVVELSRLVGPSIDLSISANESTWLLASRFSGSCPFRQTRSRQGRYLKAVQRLLRQDNQPCSGPHGVNDGEVEGSHHQ